MVPIRTGQHRAHQIVPKAAICFKTATDRCRHLTRGSAPRSAVVWHSATHHLADKYPGGCGGQSPRPWSMCDARQRGAPFTPEPANIAAAVMAGAPTAAGRGSPSKPALSHDSRLHDGLVQGGRIGGDW